MVGYLLFYFFVCFFLIFKNFYFYLFFLIFGLFRATPVAYGGSQARGRIGAVATGLRQSHSNAGSEPRLQRNLIFKWQHMEVPRLGV